MWAPVRQGLPDPSRRTEGWLENPSVGWEGENRFCCLRAGFAGCLKAAGACSSAGAVSQQLQRSSKSAKPRAASGLWCCERSAACELVVGSLVPSPCSYSWWPTLLWQGKELSPHQGNTMQPTGLGESTTIPCGPPQPGSICFRELIQFSWRRKGAQMHLCWELLLLCARRSRELLLCGMGGTTGEIVVQKNWDDLVRVWGGRVHELQC